MTSSSVLRLYSEDNPKSPTTRVKATALVVQDSPRSVAYRASPQCRLQRLLRPDPNVHRAYEGLKRRVRIEAWPVGRFSSTRHRQSEKG